MNGNIGRIEMSKSKKPLTGLFRDQPERVEMNDMSERFVSGCGVDVEDDKLTVICVKCGNFIRIRTNGNLPPHPMILKGLQDMGWKFKNWMADPICIGCWK